MKKSIIILCTFMLCSISSFIYAYNTNQHTSCLSERWKIFGSTLTYGLYYDSESIEKENYFNPFQDKIISFWVTKHYDYTNDYLSHSTFKTKYEFNLDKRTYKILSAQKKVERHIEPDSTEEFIYKKAKSLYSE